MRIAVAGNPNSGKSTLFNAVTGARARVGNYPGVTVERKEAPATLRGGRAVWFIDLPGCYSLTARSPEEEIAHEILTGRIGAGRPDAVVCVVDATNLSRGLYLVRQLIEMELPVLVALNMMDAAREQGLGIDIDLLSRRLGVPVLATAARSGEGIGALLERMATEPPEPARCDVVGDLQLEQAVAGAPNVLRRVSAALLAAGMGANPGESLWWLTSDPTQLHRATVAHLPPDLLEAVAAARREVDPQGTGAFNRAVIEARYQRVDRDLEGVVTRAPGGRAGDPGHRLDRLLLHPVGGMVVFVATMFVLFQAVFAWAEPMIGWVEALVGALADVTSAALPEGLVRSLIVNGVLAGIGNILVFIPQIALLFLGIGLLEESGYMARAATLLDGLMRRAGLHGKSFVPLMSSFACAVPGIMAARGVEHRRDRLVTILVAPFMSCSARLPVYTLVIGAVFATAAPVLGVLSVGGLVITAMYFLGFAAAVMTAAVLKRSVLRAPSPPLIIELPQYRWPHWRNVGRGVYERCRVFVTQTGTVILAISVLLWGMLTFPQQGLPDETYAARAQAAEQAEAAERERLLAQLERDEQAAQLEGSIGGRIGHAIEPVIAPLGFDWRIGIGLVASFAAREVLVSTLGQVYALDAEIEPDSPALRDALLADLDPATGRPRFTPLVGLSLMVFFVLAMQCMSTFATVKRETNSWRWPLAQLLYMNTLAYVASLVVYQVGARWMG